MVENGSGALLHEGIKIIETGSSTPEAFVQQGRIVAGSYEYHVKQGTASGSDRNNWYLTHQADTPDPDDAPDVIDNDRPAPGEPSDAVNVYRPEGGSYASNLAAANTLFNTRLQDRQGGSWYTDPATGERHMTSLWLRTSGGHSKGRMSDGQNTSSSNRVVVQLGGALLQGSVNGTDSYQLGVMAGYGKQDNDIHNSLSGYGSRGEVSGYSAGPEDNRFSDSRFEDNPQALRRQRTGFKLFNNQPVMLTTAMRPPVRAGLTEHAAKAFRPVQTSKQ